MTQNREKKVYRLFWQVDNTRGQASIRRKFSAFWLSSNAGLTKVPIDGQPKSIVRDLEDMARTYIKVCDS